VSYSLLENISFALVLASLYNIQYTGVLV